MNILEEIIAHKYKEVAEKKQLVSIAELEKSKNFGLPIFSLKQSLIEPGKSGIIAEFKRRSPSKGIINLQALVEPTTQGYVQAGASALSILTDEKYFGGKNIDVITARETNECPILRKEFVVDEYQIVEAKSLGADAILLIAACLSKDEINKFAKFAKSFGLEVLLELHGEDEFDKISGEVELVGINNRNLKTFEVNIDQSKKLAAKIPDSFIKISESGLNSPDIVNDLRRNGFKGFLMGEHFMNSLHPDRECTLFIRALEF
jgi:indole-3-glycerol phosphate synthase